MMKREETLASGILQLVSILCHARHLEIS